MAYAAAAWLGGLALVALRPAVAAGEAGVAWLDRPAVAGPGDPIYDRLGRHGPVDSDTPLDDAATPVPLPPALWPAVAVLGGAWYWRRHRGRA